jgi:hypothetical protein
VLGDKGFETIVILATVETDLRVRDVKALICRAGGMPVGDLDELKNEICPKCSGTEAAEG